MTINFEVINWIIVAQLFVGGIGSALLVIFGKQAEKLLTDSLEKTLAKAIRDALRDRLPVDQSASEEST